RPGTRIRSGMWCRASLTGSNLGCCRMTCQARRRRRGEGTCEGLAPSSARAPRERIMAPSAPRKRRHDAGVAALARIGHRCARSASGGARPGFDIENPATSSVEIQRIAVALATLLFLLLVAGLAAVALDHGAVEIIGGLDQRGAYRLAGRRLLLVAEVAADAAGVAAQANRLVGAAPFHRAR